MSAACMRLVQSLKHSPPSEYRVTEDGRIEARVPEKLLERRTFDQLVDLRLEERREVGIDGQRLDRGQLHIIKRLDVQDDIQVARRPAAHSGLAVARGAQPRTGVHAGGNPELDF